MISIIDDDVSVRTATDNLLTSLGYAVLTFASAEEFLQSDTLDETSCVISDINMPVINGVELLGLLRAQGKRMPFIFITAFPDERMSRQALGAGAICLLSKPFEEDSLIQSLEQALQTRDDGSPDR
jgi:FixJ family two-component response regulator